MKTTALRNLIAVGLIATLASASIRAAAQTVSDPGWPRVFKKNKQELTVYQPQVDYWLGYTNLHFRCAIALKGVSRQEKFGVVEVDALTLADHDRRLVSMLPLKRELRFANVATSERAQLEQAAEQLYPSDQVTLISLDRVIAYLDPAQQPVQRPVDLNLEPPRIFSSRTPAILVIFLGEPQFRPVETNRTDLLFALNTNWDVVYDTASRQYYLLNGEGWLTTSDVLNGSWAPAKALPPSIYSLPNTENWVEARRHVPGRPPKIAPTVFVTIEPAEMIVTEGTPSFTAIPGTRLLRVHNTESVLFLHSGDGKLYYLVAGRWFRAPSLDGPWSAASRDLPSDFAKIPDDDPMAFVKASVPGTREAQDAVLLASIPRTTAVQITNVTTIVTYSGAPQFVAIPSTTVQVAVNTPSQVFLVNGGYYWCVGGTWLCGPSATGPWTYCTSVPAAIYAIPPSNPNYNVTYVVVQSATPTTVVYSQSSGYSGQYVAATGVLMFGMGMLVGAAVANDHDHYYYYPPPCHYSYGCGAVYHHGYGGYYAGHASYGPYGGAGRAAAYNPHTGTYARSSYAYGPYGSASRSAAYNPYTGAGVAGGRVNTAYGSAGGAAAYDPSTGHAVRGGYRSSDDGTAAGFRTSEGSGKVAWETDQGQGAVAKTRSGDIYASNGDTVYRKDSNGGWSHNSGDGWESVNQPRPQATATSATSTRQAQAPSQTSSVQPQRSVSESTVQRNSTAPGNRSRDTAAMESQAQARHYGDQQAQRVSQYQSSGSRRGGRSTGTRSYSRRSSGGRRR